MRVNVVLKRVERWEESSWSSQLDPASTSWTTRTPQRMHVYAELNANTQHSQHRQTEG